MAPPLQQPSISSFFASRGSKLVSQHKTTGRLVTQKKKKRPSGGSSFQPCPICHLSIPWHNLEQHASSCNGPAAPAQKKEQLAVSSKRAKKTPLETKGFEDHGLIHATSLMVNPSSNNKPKLLKPTDEPIPGLFVFEEFITEEEEQAILEQLDCPRKDAFLPWKLQSFNGKHRGKRWGVHCNLRDRKVFAPENPLPPFMRDIVLPRLQQISRAIMMGCVPNECNAIDYRRQEGHYLTAHVDDRQLSKEPIANLSLAGHCVMTFANTAPHRNMAVREARVWLPRRCLQILTGKARYDFSHAIHNEDLSSDRRVSVTMRESPITK